MDTASAILFLKIFLPEGNVNQRGKKNELRIIGSTLDVLLKSIGKQLTTEVLFTSFQELSYAIAVVEPLKQGEQSPPYLLTNSHSICIGVDAASLEKLALLAKAITNKKLYRSQSLKSTAGLLATFG